MRSVSHSKSFELAVPVADIFPLLSPEGEKAWVPGWQYETPMDTSELSEDYVFLTKNHDHGSAAAIWIVKRYDPTAYLAEFYKIEPDEKVGVVTVHCTELDNAHTSVRVTYKYQALSAGGEEFVTGFTPEVYDEFINEWQTLLQDYFRDRAQTT